MSQERIKILKMLQENIITSDEALELLEQIGKNDHIGVSSNSQKNGLGYEVVENSNKSHKKNRKLHKADTEENSWQNIFNFDVDEWVDNVIENVEESVKDISDYISNNYSPFDYMKHNHEATFISEEIFQDISKLKLYAKNSICEIIGHGENHIQIQAFYKSKGDRDPQINFEEQHGNYALNYDLNAVSSMKLKVKVPDVRINHLYAENKNASIKAEDLRAKDIVFVTKSAQIKLEDIQAQSISAQTKNAPIYLDHVDCTTVQLKTTNAKLDLDKVNAQSASLVTFNAPVKTKNSKIENVIAKTKNAAIKLDNYSNTENNSTTVSIIEATTTNAGITVELPNEENLAIGIKAATTFGHIHVDLNSLITSKTNKSYMEAYTADYVESPHKTDLLLNTSNGKIHIKR